MKSNSEGELPLHDDEALAADGYPSVRSFSTKVENPVLSLAGKTHVHLAWCLTQLLILRGLVPRNTKMADVAQKLHSAFTSYTSDVGSENCGGWRAARLHGDGGMFGLLFYKPGPGGMRVRLGTFNGCFMHGTHNYVKATESLPGLHATLGTIAKFLRCGMRRQHYLPVALYICRAMATVCLVTAGAALAAASRAVLEAAGSRTGSEEWSKRSAATMEGVPPGGEPV